MKISTSKLMLLALAITVQTGLSTSFTEASAVQPQTSQDQTQFQSGNNPDTQVSPSDEKKAIKKHDKSKKSPEPQIIRGNNASLDQSAARDNKPAIDQQAARDNNTTLDPQAIRDSKPTPDQQAARDTKPAFDQQDVRDNNQAPDQQAIDNSLSSDQQAIQGNKPDSEHKDMTSEEKAPQKPDDQKVPDQHTEF
jgi:hypothetical protein